MNTSPVSRQPQTQIDPATIASYEPVFTPVSGAPLNKSQTEATTTIYAQSAPCEKQAAQPSLKERANEIRAAVAQATLTPQCRKALSDAEKKFVADFQKMGPQFDAFREDLKHAGPALKALGKDGVNLMEGLKELAEAAHNADIAHKAWGVPVVGVPITLYEGVMCGIHSVEGAMKLYDVYQNAGPDWAKAKPELQRLWNDLKAMGPGLKQLKDDAMIQGGIVGQQCIRM